MKLRTILKKLYRQLSLLFVVAVVMLAAYVSIGREFMPAISSYTAFFEGQIYESTGLPVQIDSITGSFDGFNPILQLNGLSLLFSGDSELAGSSALQMGSASIVVDMPRSLWQRRWVLEEFAINGLEFDLLQNESGAWEVAGLASAGGANIDLDTLYQTFLRVNRLDLNSVTISAQNNSGTTFMISEGTAIIQNRGNEHYLHVNASLDDSDEPVVLSLELGGSRLANVYGEVHLDIPATDYSDLLRGTQFGELSIDSFTGGGAFWLTLDGGELRSATSDIALENLVLRTPGDELLSMDNIAGLTQITRSADGNYWQGILADFHVDHRDHYWQGFNMGFAIRANDYIEVTADHLYLDLLADLAMGSNLLNSEQQEQLSQYAPTGSLRNLTVDLPLSEDSNRALSIRGNAESISLGSVRGSPNMWGINGYVEIAENEAGQIVGFAEVESDEFSINIPNVFTQVWDYSYVNGRLDFRIDLSDGQDILLVSNVVVAESDAVDGHVEFTSNLRRYPDGERDAHLELVVGASRFDAAQKTLYLPDGPNVQPGLRNTMEFLERAIVSGQLRDSAVLYRGSTVTGSGPMEKTFQSFFRLEDGVFAFNEEWPALESVTGVVKTSDNDIAVQVSAGTSQQLRIGEATGIVRKNAADETELLVTGDAAGTTAAGLAYLQSAPVGEGLKRAFSTWQTEGNFSTDIEVLLPIGRPGAQPDIRLELALADNNLSIPDYELDFQNLSGPIVFDTRTGVEDTELQAELFNNAVNFTLGSSLSADGVINTITLAGSGRVAVPTLAAWPRQSTFVRGLLNNADGDFAYTTQLVIDQSPESSGRTRLSLQTDLQGAVLHWPAPFGKEAAGSSALALELQFDESELIASGSLNPNLHFQIDLDDGQLTDGLVYVGDDSGQLTRLVENESDGLAILGELERFELAQWTDFLASLALTNEAGQSTEGASANAAEAIAFIDVTTDVFSLYEEEINNVAFRLEPDAQVRGWQTRLTSENLQGRVTIPYDSAAPLQLNLEYLRLPGPESPADEPQLADVADLAAGAATDLADGLAENAADSTPEERTDPLLGLDPRQLPAMQFSVDEFMIGDRDFGSWAFNLRPTDSGAEFSDLSFDFRGLRVGMGDESDVVEQQAPHFSWYFDGNEHRSALTATVSADDISEVLLANGFAASLTSSRADFVTDIQWPGSPAFFAGSSLSGDMSLRIMDGRFLQDTAGSGALKLVSIINFSAIMRRLRFSDDLLRRGLAFDEITGNMELEDGLLHLRDRLVISGPSSLYQITGDVDLAAETINGEMYVTLPVSDNIPWLGLLTANIPLAVGAYLFDQIFGDQVDSLTSAVYTLQGPWEGLQPEFKQAFGSPEDVDSAVESPAAVEQPVAPQ